jgi:SAM-dependent methyltransferase
MRLVDRVRSAVYDAAIVGLTADWYRAVLDRLPSGCRLLDVGIGTGAALVANADLLRAKDVRVTGVDVDAAYVDRCRRTIVEQQLDRWITVRLESIDAHAGGPYDAVYFSASFMLLPDPGAALCHVRGLLAPGGTIYFTQTFEHRRSAAVERLKPLLRLVTTIDFGRVTYESDFRRALADGGLTLEALETLDAGRRRSGILATATPAA